MDASLTIDINGEELIVFETRDLSTRLGYFRDPAIFRLGCDTLSNPIIDLKTAKIFFRMAVNDLDFSAIPSQPTPEDERTRNVLLFLSRRYGFSDLESELTMISNSLSVSSWHIVRHPTDIFKEANAIIPLSDPLNSDRPRFGPLREVMLSGESGRFVGKYIHFFEVSEPRLSQYRAIMERFCTFNHRCLAPIVCCCVPHAANMAIIVNPFYPRGSLQSLLENPTATSRLTSTMKSMFICEFVCGLFYLHCEQVVHGDLTPRTLLFDDDFHLHISGFATTSLLAAKVVRSRQTLAISHYAAPEVLEGQDSLNSTFKRRSKIDIYSLGFIIYELFGNEKWAEGVRSAEIGRRAQANIRPALPGGINVRLGELICGCWDSDPDKRPTIEEV
jgi:hypothetical protein